MLEDASGRLQRLDACRLLLILLPIAVLISSKTAFQNLEKGCMLEARQWIMHVYKNDLLD